MSAGFEPAPDLDEDLFNFDDLLAESRKAAPAPAASSAPAAAGAAVPAPRPVAPVPSAGLFAPAPAAAALFPAAPASFAGPEGPEPAEDEAASAPLALGPAALALLVAMVSLNLALVGFCVKSLRSVKGAVLDIGKNVAATTEEMRKEAADLAQRRGSAGTPSLGALAAITPEGLSAIQTAQELLRLEEFERARRLLFGLLAVADRIDSRSREDVEARASFLIADSWRLEAEARARPGESR